MPTVVHKAIKGTYTEPKGNSMFMFEKSEPKRKGRRDEVLPPENEGLPDSHRPSGLCPRCGKQSSFDIAGSLPVTDETRVSKELDTQLPTGAGAIMGCVAAFTP